MDQTLVHRIRERAYHIWMETGGTPDQNWLRAETEVMRMGGPRTLPDQGSKKRSRKSSRKEQSAMHMA
jgi:hypothetical protein